MGEREGDFVFLGLHRTIYFQVILVLFVFEFELYIQMNNYSHIGAFLPFYRTVTFFKYLSNARKSKRI